MRLTYVVGASPDKWLRTWNSRHPSDRMESNRIDANGQFDALDAGHTDLAIVRIPDSQEALAEAKARGFAIELYRERSVLVVPRDHPYADLPEISLADASELAATPEQPTVEDTLAVTAAGVGAVQLPMSVARLFHRRDLVAIPMTDGPEWPVLLVWRIDSDAVQDFVGITRGRGLNSSR